MLQSLSPSSVQRWTSFQIDYDVLVGDENDDDLVQPGSKERLSCTLNY